MRSALLISVSSYKAGDRKSRRAQLTRRAPTLRKHPRKSAPHDEHIDREELRRSSLGRRSTHHLCHRRAKALLHKVLKRLTGLPHVVDVEALLTLSRAMQDQP